jgi:HAD superfamily hydrolase (TIGR01484 family)
VVTICTGRALVECREVIEKLEQIDPVIVSGGALVACPRTERTLERFAMSPDLIGRVSAYLHERGRAAIVLKDAHAAGYDYLAISPNGRGAIDRASSWWFEHMKARVRYVESILEDEHPEHTIRIGAYQANSPIMPLVKELQERFHAEVMLQHFDGVLLPADERSQDLTSVHVVELFDPKACKGQALERLAAQLGVPMEQTAAMGDQTNDLSMIERAGLGIAMGNAAEAVKAVAKRQTRSVGQGGVAHAVENMLSGAW